jgi:hypothetical protein
METGHTLGFIVVSAIYFNVQAVFNMTAVIMLLLAVWLWWQSKSRAG